MQPTQPSPHEQNGNLPQEDVFVFPTTVAQRRFWLLDQLVPGNPALNVPLAARLTGTLDRPVLDRAVNELLRRHEVLRTSFRALKNEVVQVVSPERSITLDWFDITGLPVAEREKRVHELMLEEGAKPFSLATGPLLRGGLIKVRDDEHVVMLTMHHIGCDGWSNGILIRDLAQIYTSLISGGTLPADPPLQYADFAEWQENWLKSPPAARQGDFWRDHLQGNLPVPNLPSDRPRRAGRSHSGSIQTRLLPQPLQEALMGLCHREGVTPFMLFMAVYGVLVHRYTGEPDVVVGCPAANRSQTDLEDLIGLFSNPLVLRLKVAAHPTFRSFLARVRDLSLEAFNNQAYPFEKLLEEIQPDIHKTGSPWLRVYFIFQRAFMQPQQMPGLLLQPLRSISPGAMFEWTLGVLERAEGIRLQLEYNTDLFDAATIDRMLEQFQQILETTLRDLDAPIATLPMLTPGERKLILGDFNQTNGQSGDFTAVREAFEKVAGETPEATAISSGAAVLTYAQLNARANQLAHHLRLKGAGPDSRIGLAVGGNTLFYAVGLLAILKTGACAVLLGDPATEGGMSRRLRTAGLKTVVCEGAPPASLRSEGVTVISASNDSGAIDGQPNANPSIPVLGSQPALIRFTSGATGNSKGVILSHAALSNTTQAARAALGLRGGDTVALAPEELLPALLSGAALVVPPQASEFAPEAWLRWIESGAVTVAALPTARWHQVAGQLPGRLDFSPGKLRLMVLGGAGISPVCLNEWERATQGKVPVLDRYLLAETGGVAGYATPVSSEDAVAVVSVFQPAAGARLYVLDANLQPAPMGVPGDIYAGGASLASGYLTDGGTDAAGFVSDPFADGAGAGMVNTGDFGRFTARGGIEIAARSADLRQTNGFRLELSEVTSVLYRHPAVREVLVLPRAEAERTTMVAYVAARKDASLAAADLRSFAEKALPGYMVPGAFMVLENFPLTPAGAVDDARLPSPNLQPAAAAAAPRSLAELRLFSIWREVLGVENLGVKDNFFEAGGDSLLAIRLTSRIRRELNVDVPASALFQNPTVEKLAKVLSSETPVTRQAELIPLQTARSGPTLVMLLGPGSWELFNLAHQLRESTSLYASVVPLPEAVVRASSERRLESSARMEELAAPHVALLEKLESSGPLLLTGFCFAGTLAFEVAHQLQRKGKAVAGVLLLDTWMVRPSPWWLKKTWFLGHFKSILRQGPSYFWRKFNSRLEFESNRRASEQQLALSQDFGAEAPWAVTERIYRYAMLNYQPQPLSARGVLLAPRDDYMFNSYRSKDPTLGAGALFAGGVEVVEVPGNHVNILRAANVAAMAQCYRNVLEKFGHPPLPVNERAAPRDVRAIGGLCASH